MRKYFDIVWPWLERPSDKERKARRRRDKADLERISRSVWKSVNIVLEECRALATREENRARSADARATIYLGVLAAVVPLAATIVRDFSSVLDSLDKWLVVALTMGFLLSMFYLMAAGIWVFRTLNVRAYRRVDVGELLKIKIHRDEEVALCREILRSVRESRNTVNEKITCMMMAHLFLVRMFVMFVLLVIAMGVVAILPLLQDLTGVMLCRAWKLWELMEGILDRLGG